MVISEQLSNVESRIVNRSFRIEIPSEFEWINRTVSYLEHHALELPWGDLVHGHRIRLSLHEALTNAIVHGNLEVSSDLKEAEETDRFTKALALRSTLSKYSSRRVQVEVDYNEHRIAWTIKDEGKGFDIEKVLKHAASEQPSLLASGRGVMMMQAFMDDVQYQLGGRQCRLTLGNPNAKKIVGLERQDWDDLQQTFRPGNASFDICTLEDRPCQPPGAQDELTAILNPLLSELPQNEADGHEKREHQRHVYTERLQVYETGSSPRPAYARNVSQGGLCFLCQSPFQSRNVTIDLGIGDTPVQIFGEVVRCTELIPEVYDVAVRFVQPAS